VGFLNNLNFKKNVKNKYFICFLLNLLFLLAALVFAETKYEVSDDFVMETILSGAYSTEPNPHMLFVNILYGYLLKPLYYLFPIVNWYTLSLLFWGFAACLGLAYLLCNTLDGKTAFLIDLFFLCVFTNDIYILLQFTKTASFCCTVGTLLVFHSLFGDIKSSNTVFSNTIQSKSEFVSGFILCLVGSLIRMYTIYLVAPFILVLIAYVIFYNFKYHKNDKVWARYFITKILAGIGLIGIIFLCYGFNRISYKSNSEYAYYQQYAKVRAAIVDGPDYGYAEYAADLEKIGISENDYYMLRHWNFSDPEYFTLEKLNDISNVMKRHKQWRGWQSIYENIQQHNYASYPVCIACIVLLVICLFGNISNWIWYLATLIPACMLILYFFILERVLYRLEYGIFISAFLMLLYFGIPGFKNLITRQEKFKTLFIVSTCALVLHLPVYIPDSVYKLVQIEDRKSYVDNVFNASWEYDARKYRKVVNKADLSDGLIEEMKKHPEQVYLLDFNTTIQSLYYDYSAFDTLGSNYYKNFCYLSGVTMNFPDVNHCLENMGITNPIKDLTKDNVYLVDNINSEAILNYIKEHYYSDAQILWIKNVEGYDIWKISRE